MIVKAVKELEGLVNKNLDIEFALDSDLRVNLFQYRNMPQTLNWNISSDDLISNALLEIKKTLIQKTKRDKNTFGYCNVLAQMPDWNPAELIGRVPRPLSLSLYKELITDYAWIKAREEMGYYNPGFKPLLTSMFGQPFIDTRRSFNSF